MNNRVGKKRWRLKEFNPLAVQKISEASGLGYLPSLVLAARNIKPEDTQAFLHPSLERDFKDPYLIPNMQAGVERIIKAINSGEKIAVLGDFDVDGISATTVMAGGLIELGANVDAYIPRRFDEGYGLSKEVLERVREGSKPSLIITVDTGIAAKDEVEYLKSQGVDVIITDHHEPSEFVPQGVPVIDPKLDPENESHEIAGVGVALKAICALSQKMGQPELWRSYTEIACLGTISDMMELNRENRAIVKDGVEQMRQTKRFGLIALAKHCKLDLSSINADALSFSIIPRLNAAGRMSDPKYALELLISKDSIEAEALALKLEEINELRRSYEADLTEEALNKVEASYNGERCIVIGGEGWHEGVKGIVASRITNRYHVPVLIFTISDGVARGSGRSVGQVDLFRAIEQCSDLLIQFGGHAGAVGATMDAANLDAFRERLEEVMQDISDEDFTDVIELDAEVKLSQMNIEEISSLDALRPFGQGNKVPLFVARNVLMNNRGRVGKEGEHLRFNVTDGINTVACIMFRVPDVEKLVDYSGVVDIVFEAVAETWMGKTKPKLMVKDIIFKESEAKESTQVAQLLNSLFDKRDEILASGELSGITKADSFFTKIAGVSFEDRATHILGLRPKDKLNLVREANNPYDENAIAVLSKEGFQLGYLNRRIAQALAPAIDGGTKYYALVSEVTGGGDKALGVNIKVYKAQIDAEEFEEEAKQTELKLERRREELNKLSSSELTERLRKQFIGDNPFLPAQADVLQKLDEGLSVLCIMATGRGKSLLFHVHAARMGLLKKKASVFVYPLRALVSDQAFHLTEDFESLGLVVKVLTGESSQEERQEIFDDLSQDRVHVILTTPEFFTIHSEKFKRSAHVGFVVVDEAHHAGLAKGGHRSAYNNFPEVLVSLGNPQTLAVTATANAEVAERIQELLSIDTLVVDRSVRENLRLDDGRQNKQKDERLTSIVARGEKCIVYVNSREQSIRLASDLRKKIPSLANSIAFYNAGLSRKDRDAVESAFRSSSLSTIIATSAFGEGVNLPDVRHVILYHLPFGFVEFNQMSGRAGRDRQEAWVHLLFGAQDARINERIIESGAPEKRDLSALYKTLRSLAQEAGDEGFSKTNSEIAQLALEMEPRALLDEKSVSNGISIFKELGFLHTQGYGFARRIFMVQNPEHVDLENSIRYLEGLKSKDAFAEFKEWILSASPKDVLDRFIRPITP